MKIIFSLSTISIRSQNLNVILPNIIKQCDILYVNLIGYDEIPEILRNNKRIKINNFKKAGSEIRFYNYINSPDNSYYFTIDDDILYPEDYTNKMIEHMSFYGNENLVCVHGSNIDKRMERNFYKKNRQVYHFTDHLDKDKEVMIPGVGTSCFYKKNMKINFFDYNTPNMSDTYTACFLSEQKIKRIAIKRESNWLKPLNEFGRKIYGNNPYEEIDKVINKYKSIL